MTEVLVMCSACGRAQKAGAGACVSCGAALPEAPLPRAEVLAPASTTESNAPAAPLASPVDLRLGAGVVARVGEGALALTSGNRVRTVPLNTVAQVRLEVRSSTVLMALPVVFAVAAALVPWPIVRGLLLGGAAGGVLAALRHRRFVIVVAHAGGELAVTLGRGRVGSRAQLDAHARYMALADVVRRQQAPPS